MSHQVYWCVVTDDSRFCPECVWVLRPHQWNAHLSNHNCNSDFTKSTAIIGNPFTKIIYCVWFWFLKKIKSELNWMFIYTGNYRNLQREELQTWHLTEEKQLGLEVVQWLLTVTQIVCRTSTMIFLPRLCGPSSFHYNILLALSSAQTSQTFWNLLWNRATQNVKKCIKTGNTSL